jgi:transposase
MPAFPLHKALHMAKRKKRSKARTTRLAAGDVAHADQGTLRSYQVGALPILDHLFRRMKLHDTLVAALGPDDPRTTLPTTTALLVLVRNLLVARQPVYGVGEWAARYAPELLDLAPAQVALINDDRVGRALLSVFFLDASSFVLIVAAEVVREFGIDLDELHNDSTTITVYGVYADAATENRCCGQPTVAITFGHNKDHRPDLKQLLYILTVSADGGVPLHFRVASGNTTDDQTHCHTWDFLCKLAGRKDFLYIADCKLATRENMAHIAKEGRFLTILPRTRSEDAAFRQRLRDGKVRWRHLWNKTGEKGQVLDQFSIADEPTLTSEGYRLIWLHSTRKAELDQIARNKQIDRAVQRLGQLRQKLIAPRTRWREAEKVQQAVAKILEDFEVADFVRVQVIPQEQEHFRQEQRGRPGKDTRYVKTVTTRFELKWELDPLRMAAESATDGLFPLVTNDTELSAVDLLHAYKRQPAIEKRFSQLKTDFAVAPVYLKDVRRIQALLCAYFLALLVEALLERELRQAMAREKIASLPLYPEGRACRWPTARRVIDLFENIERHEWVTPEGNKTVLVTKLSKLQRKILRLLGLDPKTYGHCPG